MITLTLSMSNTKSDIKITDILAFDMNIKKNCHTAVHITGVIAEDIGETVIFQQLEQSTITVSETKNDETFLNWIFFNASLDKSRCNVYNVAYQK